MRAARTLWAALAAGLLLAGPALAEKPARKDSPFGNIGGGGKDPIKIDADRLDVFDRENKAVFAGNVVAVQGDSTIRCSTMTVTYKRGRDAPGKGAIDEILRVGAAREEMGYAEASGGLPHLAVHLGGVDAELQHAAQGRDFIA